MRKKKILIDLSVLKHRYCGLGQIAFNYGEYYKKHYTSSEDYELYFLLPRKMVGAFGNNVNYVPVNFFRRLFPFLIPKVDVWHSIHQLASIMPFYKKTKHILTIHDFNYVYEKSPEKARRYLKKAQVRVNRADKIACISFFAQQETERYMKLNGKKVEVIYNGVEWLEHNAIKRPAYVDEDKPFFFTIGQVRQKKNFHVLLPMMKLFPDKKLYIAGENKTVYSQELERIIKEENLTNVHLIGVVTDEERVWLYKHCESFLFPSLLEGFGLPVIEAMQFGKPVFSSKETSLKEIGGSCVFFWDTFDPDDMKKVIDEQLDNFYKSPDLAEKSRIYALSFSYQKHIERYLDIYLTV
jgi:glycosyltransferase involved in cell wall biosynthesis